MYFLNLSFGNLDLYLARKNLAGSDPVKLYSIYGREQTIHKPYMV